MQLFSHKLTFQKSTGPTAEKDWWQMIYLIANFLNLGFYHLNFFYQMVLLFLSFYHQHSVSTAYSTLSILLLGENSFVKGLGGILLKFRFSSCFRKHFTKFFKGYHQLIIGYFPLVSIQSPFAQTVLTKIFCNLLMLSIKVHMFLLKKPYFFV